ncbi:MAG: helix-turn-helix domain-containing protein [Planctomycetota bacterium]
MSDPSKQPDPNCGIADVLSLFKGRWKGEVIALLFDQTMRFNELRRELPGASARALTESLRQLERDGVIVRTQFKAVPPRVEYRLSSYGNQLVPLLDQIYDWGQEHFDCVRACRAKYDAANAE